METLTAGFQPVCGRCPGEKLQPWRRGGPLFLESVRGLSQDSLSKPLLFSKLSITVIFSSVTHVHEENVQSRKDFVTAYVVHYISTRKRLPDPENWLGLWTCFWEDQVSPCPFSFMFFFCLGLSSHLVTGQVGSSYLQLHTDALNRPQDALRQDGYNIYTWPSGQGWLLSQVLTPLYHSLLLKLLYHSLLISKWHSHGKMSTFHMPKLRSN